MNLSFFTKIFGRSVQLSTSFGKTFSYVRDACKYKCKVYLADIYRKNNTCTSCVFNGFKYINELFQHNLINVSYLTACYLYQVMMTLDFLNDVADDTESTQKSKNYVIIASLKSVQQIEY